MNAKKIKKVRRTLRNNEVDWREKEYVRAGRQGPITLTEGCGRAVYHWVKSNVGAA